LISFRFLETVIDTFESKSHWTGNHSRRVEWLSTTIGAFLGLDAETNKHLALSAHLHDIGKIGISDILLDKPTHITAAELTEIRKHPEIGSDIFNSFFLDLLDIGFDVEGSGMPINDILTVIRHHHERFDGRGYPDGLIGRETSLPARIVQVADAVDAIISDRPYRKAFGIDYAITELVNNKGKQFDPEIVDAFVDNFESGLLLTLDNVLKDAFPST
jgi:HD-GYP domain-containing protein (c-di-GMP phosphodiesterase class II)